MTAPLVGVVTVVHRRHDHLRLQERSVRLGRPPDVRVVVAVDDPEVNAIVPEATVVTVAGDPVGLPIAAARNAGARAALEQGVQRLVFLDVDCLVDAETVAAYAQVDRSPDTVWCGPVTYLRESDQPYRLDGLAELDVPHPARPDPGRGRTLADDRWELFWSLSFALDAETWHRIGGFDEAYRGYGAEDTDFGQRAARAGCRLVWAGSARAFHQWHPASMPPVGHRHDIVRNANLFRDRWGWWPMSGWLHQLRELDHVALEEDRWVVTT